MTESFCENCEKQKSIFPFKSVDSAKNISLDLSQCPSWLAVWLHYKQLQGLCDTQTQINKHTQRNKQEAVFLVTPLSC